MAPSNRTSTAKRQQPGASTRQRNSLNTTHKARVNTRLQRHCKKQYESLNINAITKMIYKARAEAKAKRAAGATKTSENASTATSAKKSGSKAKPAAKTSQSSSTPILVMIDVLLLTRHAESTTKKDSAGIKKANSGVKKNSATTSKASAAKAKQVEAAMKKTSAAAKKTTSAAAKKAAPASKKTSAPASKAAANNKKTIAGTKKAEPKMAANQGRKRKAADEEEEVPAQKKRKADTKKESTTPSEERKIAPVKEKKEKPKKVEKPLPEINQAPTARLDLFVFGNGDNCELGLGTKSNATEVTRPRLNKFLSGDVGVVHVAIGGMHGLALTHDNKIYSWGVNDNGVLGRNTDEEDAKLLDADEATRLNEAEEGPLVVNDNDDDDDDSDDDDDDNGLNKKECTPMPIPTKNFPEGVKFAQLAAGDSISVALTTDGRVFAWGTFRDNQGETGFDAKSKEIKQKTPVHIAGLKNIVQIACGNNHVVALDKDGTAWTWGTGPECQLGRRTIERRPKAGLVPSPVGVPKKQITKIFCGPEHSFAIDKKGNVWAWGLNSMGQCGIPFPEWEEKSTVAPAAKVDMLKGRNIASLVGGGLHSVALTENGEVITFGATGWNQAGINIDDLPEEDFRMDSRGKRAMTLVPHVVPDLVCDVVAAAGEVTIAVDRDGKAYSWGQSSQGNLGQGAQDAVVGATPINNTAVRDRKLVWAGCGGQFSVLAALQEA